MSYFLADSTGPLTEFASIGGYSDFRSWAQTQSAPIRRFVHFGFTEDLKLLVEALKKTHAPGELEVLKELLLGSAEDAQDILVVSDGMSSDEELRAAAEAKKTLVHKAAEAFERRWEVACHYAFAAGRSAIKHDELRSAKTVEEADKAVALASLAMRAAFSDVLPSLIEKCLAAGGSAGIAILAGQFRTAGGAGSGNFGHAGRPGERGGSTSSSESGFGLWKMPERLFHGTQSNALEMIKVEGLRPAGGKGADSSSSALYLGAQHVDVFFTSRVGTAREYAKLAVEVNPGSRALVLEIRIPPEHRGHVLPDTGSEPEDRSWQLRGTIRPEWIIGIVDRRGKLRSLGAANTVYIVLLVAEDNTADLRTAKREDDFHEMRFDSKNPHAVKWARKHVAKLLDDLTLTSQHDIAEAIIYGHETGDLRGQYKQILAAVGDKDRAKLISRNETMVVASKGQRLAWDQAVEAGLLPADAEREWITADLGACAICENLNGKTAKLDGEYPDEGGEGPPQHVQCLCTEGISAGR